jgi:methyl-accepting chemotaxis protein
MKIYVVIGMVIGAMAVAGIYTVYSLMASTSQIAITRQVELEMLRCRRHEKDFLVRRDTTYAGKHADAFNRLVAGAGRIETATPGLSILRHAESYQLAFQDIVAAMSEVGLTENDGLRGELRRAIQNAEGALAGHDELIILMLSCRRHEKDFLLRSDTIYVTRFERSVDELLRAVLSSELAAGGQFRVPDLIVAYREAFRSLVDRMVGIGLDQNEGLRGKMRAAVHQTESVLEQLHSIADIDRERTLRSSIAVGVIMAALTAIATWLLLHAKRKDAALREVTGRV